MNVLITGADRALGKLLKDSLGTQYDVRAVERDDCDHRDPEAIGALCEGLDAILHCDVFDPIGESDEVCLDWASRGTYVLMQAAILAGVERVVVASKLSLFEAYPDRYVVDETWQPKPDTNAESLAPYLAELTCREFARQGGIQALCLRLDVLGVGTGTTNNDAVRAFDGALNMELEPNGYRWEVFHISSNERFSAKQAKRVLSISQGDH